jgi:hypothetical protein
MGKEFDEGYFDANADAEGFISKVRLFGGALMLASARRC